MIKTHKITKQRLLLKRDSGLVSTFFVLDEFDNKILDKNKYGRQMYNVNGDKSYKIAICLNKNIY
ncbi:hypothetical protein Phi10:1_gp056 [Cellulophaga phage phi10:1]|uniref:Uncharacterized protein n=1 Tax=Cellulophaga phage phi10:1 TaxID=1327981 RepID=S0A1N0_9CAUD|nr:hypothetical protein Phi10:1_gp056 [Cellulophaga phage phi10:1]AGO48397.1 hypothetical protein Phi10:1_gp056 [Cellulophaga phage phi10:1]